MAASAPNSTYMSRYLAELASAFSSSSVVIKITKSRDPLFNTRHGKKYFSTMSLTIPTSIFLQAILISDEYL